MTKADLGQLQQIARESRVQIIRMLTHAGSGHPGGSLSVIDSLTVLYFSRMRYDAKQRLQSFQTQEKIAFLEDAVRSFRSSNGRFPASLAQVQPLLPKTDGAPSITFDGEGRPLDPSGVPYAYDPATGIVRPGPKGVPLPVKAMKKPGG